MKTPVDRPAAVPNGHDPLALSPPWARSRPFVMNGPVSRMHHSLSSPYVRSLVGAAAVFAITMAVTRRPGPGPGRPVMDGDERAFDGTCAGLDSRVAEILRLLARGRPDRRALGREAG